MSWTLLVSCNSFKLKVVQKMMKMIILSEMPDYESQILEIAKQCQAVYLVKQPSAETWRMVPLRTIWVRFQAGMSFAIWVATIFGHRRHRPQIRGISLGNNLLQLEVSVCLRVSLSRQNGSKWMIRFVI